MPSRSDSVRYKTVRTPKASDLIARTLRTQIIRGELYPDEGLPSESELMSQFGVSRPTLREAYRILESEGLITIRRGALGGPRAQVPTADVAARYAGMVLQYQGASLRDLADARQIFEPQAAAVLARRGRKRDIVQLKEVLEHERDHDHNELWEDPFHLKVMELAGNQTLELFSHITAHIMHAAKAAYLSKATERGPAEAETALDLAEKSHRKLIELIEEGDADKATEFWSRHLRKASDRILAAMPDAKAIDLIE